MRRHKILYILITSLILSIVLIGQINVVFAGSIMPEGECKDSGSCELSDLAQLAISIARWILGIVGSLALLAFVYGGVLFLISGGNRETVQKGKQVMIGAVIGLAIVFASYLIVGFVLQAMGSVYQGSWMNIKK
ncbi:hypothetical protein ACFLZ9_01495 [Patescibacteria group bacterium]